MLTAASLRFTVEAVTSAVADGSTATSPDRDAEALDARDAELPVHGGSRITEARTPRPANDG